MAKQKTKASAAKNNKKNASASAEDIIQLILADHKPLKKLIKTMKGEGEFSEKKKAFNEFAPLLISHAKPEEKTWYEDMKADDEMKVEGLEGDVEHGLADQMCEELKRTNDEDMFMAKVKVLAELVEHHIEEEEEEMLPDYKKNSTLEERAELGRKYLKMQAVLESVGGEDAPRQGSKNARKLEEAAQAHRI